MRGIIVFLALASLVGAQEYQKGTASTQQTPVGFALPVATQGKILYVKQTTYRRDSSGVSKLFDTASYRPYSGAAGACSNEIGIENIANAVQPTTRCEISYRLTASDTSQDRILFRVYTRYKTPAGLTDTSWRAGQSIWDSVPVILTHTPPQTPSPNVGISWGHSWGLSGAYAKICVERVNVGSGDSVTVTLPVLRCW